MPKKYDETLRSHQKNMESSQVNPKKYSELPRLLQKRTTLCCVKFQLKHWTIYLIYPIDAIVPGLNPINIIGDYIEVDLGDGFKALFDTEVLLLKVPHTRGIENSIKASTKKRTKEPNKVNFFKTV
jgi:hypothetical protein